MKEGVSVSPKETSIDPELPCLEQKSLKCHFCATWGAWLVTGGREMGICTPVAGLEERQGHVTTRGRVSMH